MNPYRSYVERIANAYEEVKAIEVRSRREVVLREKKVLLFSPHPDDECIIGLLPLRMQLELGYEVVNIPMTFGSDKLRRAEREQELESACSYLGWTNYRKLDRNGENLTRKGVLEILRIFQPKAILFPHAKDWNTRHVEVHQIVMDALSEYRREEPLIIIESEYWGAMSTPNVLVEGSIDEVAELVAATSLHKKEVSRNPYHLRLPAWMQDNVRRGAELVGGQGKEAPEFLFGTLYRISLWSVEGQISALTRGGCIGRKGELSVYWGQLEKERVQG